MVSATLSPLDALETVSLGKPRTCPPRFSIAASKRKAGTGGRLVEQGSQLFVGGHVLIGSRVGADAVGQVQQRGDLLLTESNGSIR